MNITVLCTTAKSVYLDLGLDCYDIERNTRTFAGTNPVICHPPCRGWTRFGKAMNAKPRPGEKDLSYFCFEKMITNGGIFEHPYESQFAIWASNTPGVKSIVIMQEWFGYFAPKKTLLLMPEHYIVPDFPFILVPRVSSTRRYKDWANKCRHDTCLNLAKWLIKTIMLNEKGE